jgi:hypothetical protein
VIQYYDKFSRQNIKLKNSPHKKFIFIQQELTKNDILGQLYIYTHTHIKFVKDFIHKFLHLKKWKGLKMYSNFFIT